MTVRAVPGNYHSRIPGGHFGDGATGKVSDRANNAGAVNGAEWEKSWPGYITTVETTPGNHTTYFETPEDGVAVWLELMRRYRIANVHTIGGIIKRYGGGQDYSEYVSNVVRWTGLPATTEIEIDGSDDETLMKFARAMFREELGRETFLSEAQIRMGFDLMRKRNKMINVQHTTIGVGAGGAIGSGLSWLGISLWVAIPIAGILAALIVWALIKRKNQE